jgi:hypothetical protein
MNDAARECPMKGFIALQHEAEDRFTSWGGIGAVVLVPLLFVAVGWESAVGVIVGLAWSLLVHEAVNRQRDKAYAEQQAAG